MRHRCAQEFCDEEYINRFVWPDTEDSNCRKHCKYNATMCAWHNHTMATDYGGYSYNYRYCACKNKGTLKNTKTQNFNNSNY